MLWYFSVGYFSDLLAPVVMLSVANIALSFAGRSLTKLWQAILFSLACGVFWELGALLNIGAEFLLSGVTFDLLDFIAYLAGGTLFWLITRCW